MWEPLGTHGGIAPDAAVYLKESPFGAGWHYVEYERRVKSAGDMGKKLRGYESIRRRDDFPLLMVCANQLAEEGMRRIGRWKTCAVGHHYDGAIERAWGGRERQMLDGFVSSRANG